MPYRSCAINDK